MRAPQPPALQGVFIASLVGSMLIGCCAAYGLFGVIAQNIAMSSFGEIDAGEAMGGEMGGLLEVMRVLSIVSIILQVCSAGVLVAVGALGLSRHPLGRPLGIAGFSAFGLIALMEMGLGVFAWHRTQALFQLSDTAMGGSESDIVSMIGAMQLIPTGCWLLAKLALVATGVGVLLAHDATVFYQRMDGRAE